MSAGNHISPADLRQLKSYDTLQAYCERYLAPVKREACTCPFGSHSRPLHLTLANKDGAGVAYCHACGKGGSVLDVAAAVMGVDLHGHFAEVVRHVAEAVGYTLRESSAYTPRRKGKRAGSRKAAAPMAHVKAASAPVAEYLSAEDEAAALETVRAAAAHPDKLATHAKRMGLPADTLAAHTSLAPAFAERGLIGLAPDGRLLYVYTHRDTAGRVRVACIKLRGDDPTAPKALIRRGAWYTYETMRYDSGEPVRFIFSAGKASCLYGIASVEAAGIVIITEGESDKLAFEASFQALYTLYDGDGEQIPDDHMPAIVAKPSAGTFKPEWARILRGKYVILAADGDPAGKDGAEATASLLRAEGVRVAIWQPPAPYKDARAYYAATASPLDLAADLLTSTPLMIA